MKENQIQIFDSPKFGQIRGMIVDDEPWLVLKDICNALEITNPTVASSRLYEKERAKFNLGRQGNTWFVNESGFYTIVLRSDKPKAQEFRYWVTSDVLPAIRKNGFYSINQSNNKPDSYMIEDPIARAERWIEEQKEKLALEEKIKQDAPLVEFANYVSDTSDLIDIGMLAKIAKNEKIKIGRNKLFEWLRENKYLMSKRGHKNEPYQSWIEQGLFVMREYTYNTAYGEKIGTKTYVTEKGQIYLIEKLRKDFD